MSKIPQFIIAAPTSNSGKTTITLGLLRALENRGFATQPFKVGPDYIDPKFHKVACGHVGVNLDLFMMSTDDIHQTYASFSKDKEAICIEGVMGLFDGAKKSEGSTAAVSKVLKLPIILVVDAKSVAYSVAPLLYGFKNFDPEIDIAGVIFNRVNTESHYQFLKEACDDVGIPSFGYVPFIADCEIPSRHLGLSIDEMDAYKPMISTMAIAIEKTVDVDQLLKKCTLERPVFKTKSSTKYIKKLRIGIAKDAAFNFSYVQNIKAFEALGELVYFSPLEDSEIPEVDLLYFPGGYPEFYLKKIAANKTMRAAVLSFAKNGGRIIAECGGMMYLGSEILDEHGQAFEMCGVFPFKASMKNMKLALGYRTIQLGDAILKGHEFHYSSVFEDESTRGIGKVFSARSKEVRTKIYRTQNVWATYIHCYLGTVDGLSLVLKELGIDVVEDRKQEIGARR
ncbi:MAG: cobyrinic acid a,c-diamide synthase [Flavobacteriaceae bacterium]|nr:MAG: cobyrinic acid a,c-diamide synthase [Flavobacteriaceae bacterium]